MAPAYRIARPPTAFSTSPKGKRRPRVWDIAHLKWLRTLSCLITGKHPVEACHVRYAAPEYGKRETGMAEKPHDQWTVPLHPDLHREQHSMNEKLFWLKYGIDPLRVALVLYAASGDDELAEHVIAQARQAAATMVKPPAEKCPLDKPHGEIVCRNGMLWALTHGEMGPPDNRQVIDVCPHCRKMKP